MTTSERSGKVQTVLGLIEPGDLGITMTHEHFIVDQWCYFSVPDEASERSYVDAPFTMEMRGNIGKRWNHNHAMGELIDVEEATSEILKYVHAGGRSIVDATSVGIARDPLALTRMSRRTGLNVVMGASYYVPPSYPNDMDSRSEQQITDEIIRDVTAGVGDTGVRAGIIGEIGNFWPTNENTRKVLRASAHAAVETGAPVLIHPGFPPESLTDIMDDLTGAGIDPTRVILGHLDLVGDLDGIRKVAETGAMLEYDRFGWEDSVWGVKAEQPFAVMSDVQRLEHLEQLIEWGHLAQLVIAQDTCLRTDWTDYGGKGFSHILENIVPRMRKRGFSNEQIDVILVHNPARILAFN